MAKPRLIAFSVIFLLAACSGAVSTQRVDDSMLDRPGDKVSGVVYYPPALFAEITARTAYVHDGKLVGLASDSPPACAEVTNMGSYQCGLI